MELPKEINVTEQMVDISHLTDKQTTYYKNLTDELEKNYEELGRGRQIITLSGPGGSGKSVISAILNYHYTQEASFIFINVGLDAFHFPNAVLAKRKLLDAKGRYDTYDTSLLYKKMCDFKSGKPVSFPYYSREIHNPIEDQLQVTKRDVLLLLEGGWLLRNTPEWGKIRELSSFNLFVQGSIGDMRENVIRRHITGGRTTEDAMNFYGTSDLANTKEILENSVEADRKVLFYKDI
ncbi:hypothetical protein H6804_00015 [Candidatus Nomurabacteria bacterium]|nr:hypothetical protein [Candidatus Kaiserbacteria bacterium]MCB9815480.1 hypothetical protein [Candidatus Nomurabacteria bacterium]MCB9826650.1 hypothetical protein [Candidatus Nomurabacteria bacterium]